MSLATYTRRLLNLTRPHVPGDCNTVNHDLYSHIIKQYYIVETVNTEYNFVASTDYNLVAKCELRLLMNK